MAWRDRYTVSRDPTPGNSIPLQLAIQDPHGKVAYLARPCQYVGGKDEVCGQSSIYWTSHRYAPEVIDALDDAIDCLKMTTEVGTIALVGYSGGGSLAVLLAARRNDVEQLVTVAANLDHELWTTYHKVTPLYGSLNAADYATEVQDIPQVHFVGGKDVIVPEEIVLSFYDRMIQKKSTRIVVVGIFSHTCCWQNNWAQLFSQFGG